MKTAKLDKFQWGTVSDLNSGHTSNEWGTPSKRKSTQNVFVAYDVNWD
ncbi:MAG: hypothetical protein HOK63_01550 [Thaumarchaeota archaeon]|jgi:hypothetical protein|nr:hypothetical protein [Nitrososphaerota archaeon]MBT5842424.1 hypothetical protein [Nitrososphaerota archaeon]MBT6468326.1 hypothetical protein [Nitrososphaerota archaeon]